MIVDYAKPPLFIDLETRSSVDLRRHGGRVYAESPTTEIIAVSWSRDAGSVRCWINPDACEPGAVDRATEDALLADLMRDTADRSVTLVAHNAFHFDALVWEAAVGRGASWADTIPLCRMAGIPASLDGAAGVLLSEHKLPEGRNLIRKYCKPSWRTHLFIAMTDEDAMRMRQYALSDTRLLARCWERFGALGVSVGGGVQDLLQLDVDINERGVPVDLPATWKLVEYMRANRVLAKAAICKITGIAEGSIGNAGKWCDWLASQGCVIAHPGGKPTVQKDVVEAWLSEAGNVPEDVLNALCLRSEVSGVAGGKFQAILNRTGAALIGDVGKVGRTLDAYDLEDISPRLRDVAIFHGAHTGRWAGRGVQLQNLPRPRKSLEVAAAVEALDVPTVPPDTSPDTVATLVRPLIAAPPGRVLVSADFNAIECRVLAWLAGERPLIRTFEEGGDPYLTMATTIFGRPCTKADKAERQLAKVVVLGAGYSMSGDGFTRYCKAMGIDLEVAGVTAGQCIEAYRDAHPMIAGILGGDIDGRPWRKGGLWQQCHRASLDACRPCNVGDFFPVGMVAGCGFAHDGMALWLRLPSGRRMRYHGAHLRRYVPSWGGPERDQVVYVDGRGNVASTYGGKLTENLVQAVARDVLADALLEVDRLRWEVVMHVHDEIVVECDERDGPTVLSDLLRIMSTAPPWASGLPLAAEGHVERRYLKEPRAGYAHGSARGGDANVSGGAPCRI